MTRWSAVRRLLATLACVALVAGGCGGSGTEEVDTRGTPGDGTASPAPLEADEPSLTGTARDTGDVVADFERAYEDFIAATDPLPPDGGELMACDDVPELESRVEGTLGGRQNIDDDVAGVVTTYWLQHLDTFGGMWVDRAHGGAIVLTFTDDPEAHLEALLARAPSPDDYPATQPPPPITDTRPLGERDDVAIDVQQVQFTEAQLRATQRHLAQLMGPELGLMSLGGGTTRNRLELTFVDPPEGALAEATALLPTAAVCINVTRSPEPPSGPLEVIPDLDREDPLVSCAGLPPVPYSTFLDPPSLAEVDHPAVDVLEAELAAPGVEPLPEGDWVVLGLDDDQATFATLGDDSFGYARVSRQGDAWVLSGWGQGGSCDAVVALPEGLGRVEIRLDPGSLPEPDDTVIDLLVTEVDCAGGREMGDALLGPQVVETDDAVLVAFAAISVVGGATCPGNPATSVSVELEHPLGDRALLDGLAVPPREIIDEAADG